MLLPERRKRRPNLGRSYWDMNDREIGARIVVRVVCWAIVTAAIVAVARLAI